MKMFMAGAPYGAVEVELEDALEEIQDFPFPVEGKGENAFVGLEDEKHRILNIVHLGSDEWGIIFGNAEKRGVKTNEMKGIVKDFFEGRLPDWVYANEKDRNDFPDGIDEILEW
jgi:hypothetical protein